MIPPMVEAIRRANIPMRFVQDPDAIFSIADLSTYTVPTETSLNRRTFAFGQVPTVTIANADSLGDLIVDFTVQGIDSRCIVTAHSVRIRANAVAGANVSLGADILVPQFITIQNISGAGANDTFEIGYDLGVSEVHVVAERVYARVLTDDDPIQLATTLTARGRLQGWVAGSTPSKPTATADRASLLIPPNDFV